MSFKYLFLFIGLFLIEIYIALYMHGNFIRSYVGDTLVVILLYTLIASFYRKHIYKTAFSIFIFASCVEIAQYFKIVNILGLKNNALASALIGTTFSWIDIFSYFLGAILILFFEITLPFFLKKNLLKRSYRYPNVMI